MNTIDRYRNILLLDTNNLSEEEFIQFASYELLEDMFDVNYIPTKTFKDISNIENLVKKIYHKKILNSFKDKVYSFLNSFIPKIKRNNVMSAQTSKSDILNMQSSNVKYYISEDDLKIFKNKLIHLVDDSCKKIFYNTETIKYIHITTFKTLFIRYKTKIVMDTIMKYKNNPEQVLHALNSLYDYTNVFKRICNVFIVDTLNQILDTYHETLIQSKYKEVFSSATVDHILESIAEHMTLKTDEYMEYVLSKLEYFYDVIVQLGEKNGNT